MQIIPRDSGFNDKKLNRAVQEIRSTGANVIAGPIDNKDFEELKNIMIWFL